MKVCKLKVKNSYNQIKNNQDLIIIYLFLYNNIFYLFNDLFT